VRAGGFLVLEPNFNLGHDKVRWERLLILFALIAVPTILSSCGSAATTTTTPTITASCTSTQGTGSNVSVLGTAQCTANVLNETSTLVNWSVSGSSTGSITSAGLYTAPATVPSSNVVTITATSQVQSTLTATASLTIVAATAISAVTCDDSTGNSASSVSSGNQLSCVATTSTGAIIPVNWSVTNTNKLAGDIGSISAQGIYAAPLVPPPGKMVTITATSQALATETMSVTVTVVFGNKVLHDSYAFSTWGRLTNSSDFFARVGSFTAGGGAITGFEDTNQAGASGGVKTQRVFQGSYSIGPDGRGTMQFCEDIPLGAGCPLGSPSATAFFRIVVISPQRAQIIDFSSPATNSASTTAGGEIISQDQSVFGAGTGNLAGTYSFSFTGVSSGAAVESAVGEFTANGHGTIGANSSTTPGEMDINGSAAPFASSTTYSISSNGRGAGVGGAPLTLGGLNFSFYMVSASQAKFIEIDPSSVSILVGDAYKQQATATCGWGPNVLNGSTVFETSGASSGVEIADLGSFTATNNGTTGTISAGSIDENRGGTVPTPQIATLSGSYTVDPCGKGNLTVGSHSYIFYPISTSSAVLQETTSGIVADGFLVHSQGGPFVDGSLSGSYALRLSGTNAAGTSGKREDIVGQITSDGAGKVTGGSLDINNFGATTAGAANTGTYLPDSSPTTTLRAVAHLTSAPNLVLYMVSPTQFYVLNTDATGTAIGTLNNQF
jgi:hypothetical protein